MEEDMESVLIFLNFVLGCIMLYKYLDEEKYHYLIVGGINFLIVFIFLVKYLMEI